MTQGNIVRWNGDIYIVAEVEEDSKFEPIHCKLLSSDCSNSSAHPSRTWPDDPTKRIDSVEVIADNLKDFLHTLMDNAIDQMIAIQE